MCSSHVVLGQGKKLQLKDVVAVEICGDDDAAYMLVQVVRTTKTATRQVPLEANWMGRVEVGDEVFIGQAYMPVSVGSRTFVLSECKYHIHTDCIRKWPVTLKDQDRECARQTRSRAAAAGGAGRGTDIVASLGRAVANPTPTRPLTELTEKARRYVLPSDEHDRILRRLPG